MVVAPHVHIGDAMKRNTNSIKAFLLSASILLGVGTTGLMLTSCEDKPKTLGDKIEDGLDARPNEKLKDAGEDVKDAVKDATN